MSEQTAAAIKEVCGTPAALAALQIVIINGDNKQYGNGTATHTAMLRLGGRDALGLRIIYKKEGTPIEVLGYWRP